MEIVTTRSPGSIGKRVRGENEPSSISENSDEETMNLGRMTEDSCVLFSHFPQEIWLLILGNVTDVNNLTNLMRASPVFRTLLPNPVELLFPQVWEILAVKFEKKEDEVYSYDFDEMYPGRDFSRYKFGKTPWFSRILTLRLVCKTWCRTVDDFYQNLTDKDHYQMVGDLDYYTRKRRIGEWTKHLKVTHSPDTIRTSRAEKFINHFGPTHQHTDNKRNPIVSRQFSILLFNERGQNGIFPLLTQYGQHFWLCQLILHDDFPSRELCYEEVRETLQLLPNLKTLRMSYPHPWNNRRMQPDIAAKPLPVLHQLEYLSMWDFPPSLFNGLVPANNHISMLEVFRQDTESRYDIYTFPMPNLKQLSIKYLLNEDFENLYKPEVNWGLEKLYLILACSYIPWSQIFTLLENKWAATLKTLSIQFPPTAEPDLNVANGIYDGSSTALNLPKVQRIKIRVVEMFSLDFILPMQNLEVLQVIIRKIPQNEDVERHLRLIEKNQVVQFVGFFGRFHESNIWKLFPNLKSFQLFESDWRGTGLDICTREDFERKEKTGAVDGATTLSEKDNLWVYM